MRDRQKKREGRDRAKKRVEITLDWQVDIWASGGGAGRGESGSIARLASIGVWKLDQWFDQFENK